MKDGRTPIESVDSPSVFGWFKMWWQGLQSLKRCWLRGSCLSLCFAMLLVLDTRSAWATCGDYLAGGHAMSGHQSAGLDGLSGQPSSSPPQRPTCSGPQCHQRQQPAPAAPSRQMEVPQSNDAVLCVIVRLSADDSGALHLLVIADHDASGLAGRIFRPPRAC